VLRDDLAVGPLSDVDSPPCAAPGAPPGRRGASPGERDVAHHGSGTPLAASRATFPWECTVRNLITDYLGVHAQAMPLREQRMKLIASNLGNADTPGYKAQDLDFDSALRHAQGLDANGLMTTTNEQHYEIGSGLNPFQVAREGVQPSIDGNTVDPDAERAAYGRAALEYRASLSFVESKVRSMLTAITGQ